MNQDDAINVAQAWAGPAIIAVSADSSFEVMLDIAEPGRAVSVKRRGVDLKVANAMVRETLEETGDHPVVPSLKRVREWTFDPGDGGKTWSWTTRQVVAGGLDHVGVVTSGRDV